MSKNESTKNQKLLRFLRSKMFVSLGLFFLAIYMLTLVIEKKSMQKEEEDFLVFVDELKSFSKKKFVDLDFSLGQKKRFVKTKVNASKIQISESLSDYLNSLEFDLFLSEFPKKLSADLIQKSIKPTKLPKSEDLIVYLLNSEEHKEEDLKLLSYLFYIELSSNKESDKLQSLKAYADWLNFIFYGNGNLDLSWVEIYYLDYYFYLQELQKLNANLDLKKYKETLIEPESFVSALKHFQWFSFFCEKDTELYLWYQKNQKLFCSEKEVLLRNAQLLELYAKDRESFQEEQRCFQDFAEDYFTSCGGESYSEAYSKSKTALYESLGRKEKVEAWNLSSKYHDANLVIASLYDLIPKQKK